MLRKDEGLAPYDGLEDRLRCFFRAGLELTGTVRWLDDAARSKKAWDRVIHVGLHAERPVWRCRVRAPVLIHGKDGLAVF